MNITELIKNNPLVRLPKTLVVVPLIKINQSTNPIPQKVENVDSKEVVVLYEDPIKYELAFSTYLQQFPKVPPKFWPHKFLLPIPLPNGVGTLYFYDHARSRETWDSRYVEDCRSLITSHNIYVILKPNPRMKVNGFKLALTNVRNGTDVDADWSIGNNKTKITTSVYELRENETTKIFFLSGVHEKGIKSRPSFQFELRDSNDKSIAKTLDFQLFSSTNGRKKRIRDAAPTPTLKKIKFDK
jgi:hypothetical protein